MVALLVHSLLQFTYCSVRFMMDRPRSYSISIDGVAQWLVLLIVKCKEFLGIALDFGRPGR